MPHLTIEFSANVAERVDVDELVGVLHTAALRTGIAPLDALRTRAVAREHYAIADRHPDNAFVAVTARLGPGRSHQDRHRFVAALMEALDEHLGDARQTTMLSVECQEIDPDFRLNRNHLRSVVAERATTTDDTDDGDEPHGS